jgi:hypothetical protein
VNRVAFILADPLSRDEAARLCATAEAGSYVEFIGPDDKRTEAQNRKMWPMLTDISNQVAWPPGSNMKLSPEDFKVMFLDALGQEMRLVPNLNMNGYINLGRSSSRLKKREFIDLIELIYAFGAKYGVVWKEPKPNPDSRRAA